MATFKAEVYAHQKRADGTYNIKIRVTHKQRKKYLPTQWYVGKEDLTRSLKLKNQKYIDMIEDLLRRYRRICNDVGDALDTMTVEQVVELIKNRNSGDSFELDIADYTRRHIDELMRAGRTGSAATFGVMLKSLCRFMGKESISFREITVGMLNNWSAWIAEPKGCPRLKTGIQAQIQYLAKLRTVYNKAKREFNDEDAGLIRIPFSPFNKIDIPKVPQSRKRALPVDELRAIAELPDEARPHWRPSLRDLSRDVFMLSFMLVGMNAVDLYNCTDISGDRITYRRTKTRRRRADNAEISIRIEPEAARLVEKYRDPTGERVFDFHRRYSTAGGMSSSLNLGLKKIGAVLGIDDLEFYAARHSWATIANNEAGVDKYTVHEALNHVDPSMRVTDIYIRRDWSNIDRANRAVLDLLQLPIL